MRRWIVGIALVLLSSALRAGTGNPEKIFQEKIQGWHDALLALSNIKDEATAKAARPKLVVLSKRLTDLDPGYINRSTASKETLKSWDEAGKKYEKQVKKLEEDLHEQFLRLEKLPSSWPVFADTVFEEPILSRCDEARQQVAQLSQALQTYQESYKEYPATLSALAKKQGKNEPLVDEKALLDPWERSYQYDVKGPRNAGKLPDLWSQGPLPGNAASIIGNWNAAPKKETPKK